jgi:hypothetical protein
LRYSIKVYTIFLKPLLLSLSSAIVVSGFELHRI